MSYMKEKLIEMQEKREKEHCKFCMYWNHDIDDERCAECMVSPLDTATNRPLYFEED